MVRRAQNFHSLLFLSSAHPSVLHGMKMTLHICFKSFASCMHYIVLFPCSEFSNSPSSRTNFNAMIIEILQQSSSVTLGLNSLLKICFLLIIFPTEIKQSSPGKSYTRDHHGERSALPADREYYESEETAGGGRVLNHHERTTRIPLLEQYPYEPDSGSSSPELSSGDSFTIKQSLCILLLLSAIFITAVTT